MKTHPPKHDEFEISVFGSGIGESIVIHLGNSKWAIIDSCRNGTTRRPIALEYLESLGVDVRDQVELVVVTHWHDDHIRGISEIVREAKNSEMVFSAALKSNEFSKLLAAHEKTKLIEDTSGVSEMYESLDANSAKNGFFGPHHWAAEGMQLLKPNPHQPTHIVAVSPSALTITNAAVSLGHLLPTMNAPFKRIQNPSPNSLSIALQVQFGSLVCLLGGDLENSNCDHTGWNAVVHSKVINDRKANFYKVAHHGSEGADHEEIWVKLIEPKPITIVTPYARGRKKLPAETDITRLKAKSDLLYLTAPSNLSRPKKRRSVEKTIREVALSRRAIPNVPGHVRMRYVEGTSEPVMEVFEGAQLITG